MAHAVQFRALVKTLNLLQGSLVLALTGCVSAGKYDAAVGDAERARSALVTSRNDTARLSAEKQQLAARLREREGALGTTNARVEKCQFDLDNATLANVELRGILERLGKDADALLSAKGMLAANLEQTRARLDELRKAQAAAETRAALFRELALKLKRMIDAGELQIVLRSGRMVLVLPNDVLFDSGKADIKPRGKETLGQIATALATFPGRRFQVAGHTDNEPIRLSRYESNWQLSSERALAVTAFMIQSGMAPEVLSAAGYGEFDPVAANDSPVGKAKNRRIEITLQPHIDELVAVPQSR